MKSSFLTTIIVFCFFITFGQNKSFDLSNYKTPNYERHELTTSFNLSGQHDSYEDNESSAANQFQKMDYLNSNFSSNINLNYNYYFNSRKKQIFIDAKLNPSYQYNLEKEGSDKTKISNSYLWFSIQGYEDFFLSQSKFFIKVVPRLSYSPQKEKAEYTSSTYDNKYTNLNLSLGLGAGYGRIEPVSDLWQSYYILKDFENDHLLNRDLEETDVFAFARTATQLKNKRFFDFRLRKIAELEALDSLLRNEKLINESTISYFTTLNDYWNFAAIADRYSGRELTLLITPEYHSTHHQDNDQEKIKSHYTVLYPSLTYQCNKPINLFWDRSFWLKLSNHFMLKRQPDSESSSSYFQLSSTYSYSYYPNFRTKGSLSLNYDGQEITDITSVNLKDKYWQNKFLLNTSLSYYISPQLQVNGGISLKYYDKKSFNNSYYQNDNLHITYSMKLSYAIL